MIPNQGLRQASLLQFTWFFILLVFFLIDLFKSCNFLAHLGLFPKVSIPWLHPPGVLRVTLKGVKFYNSGLGIMSEKADTLSKSELSSDSISSLS